MAEKRYYYLKLNENFFDNDEMKILESMENGYLYSNILLKLYLKSLKGDGRLTFNEYIPYDVKMLATITGHNKDVVEKALTIFKSMNLIEVLDNGAIYMLNIQNMIGSISNEGLRKAEYREKIKIEKQNGTLSQECPNIISISNSISNINSISNNSLVKEDINNKESVREEEREEENISLVKKDKKSISDILGEIDNETLRYELSEFVSMRKTKRNPLTPHALDLAINKLNKLTPDIDMQIEIVRETISRGWLSFYEPQNNTYNNNKQKQKESVSQSIDRLFGGK